MHEWLSRLDQHFPVRYTAWALCAVFALLMAFCWVAFGFGGGWALLFLGLTGLGWRDTRQGRHSVLRNYPVIGHLRFLLEFVRPEIRQYFIESDREAAPFSRQQRSLVYQRSQGRAGQPSLRHAARRAPARATNGSTIRSFAHHPAQPRISASPSVAVLCAQPYHASAFSTSRP